eukprot:65801_1
MGQACLKMGGCECPGRTEKHLTGIERYRVFTDVPCFLLFVAAWAAVIVMLVLAIDRGGNPQKLIRAVDYNGNVCGYDDSVKDLGLGAWPNPSVYDFKVCVSDCAVTSSNPTQFLEINSTKFLFYCIPQVDDFRGFSTQENTVSRYMGDLVTCKYVILISAFIAVVVSFLYAFLLKQLVGCIVWSSIALLIIFGGATAAFLLTQDPNGSDVVDVENQRKTMRYVGIAVAVIVALFALFVVFMRKRIKIAIEVVREASKAVMSLPSLLVVPVIMFIISCAVFAFWLIVLTFLWTAGSFEAKLTPTGITDNFSVYPSHFSRLVHDNDFKKAFIFHVFFLFWESQFLMYFTYAVIAGAVGQWYFTRELHGSKHLTGFPVVASFFRIAFYHMGTIAIGSLLVAVVKFARAILNYVQQKTQARSNSVQRTFFCLCSCCMLCLEKFLNMISRNAFVFTAVYGDAFCAAAGNAFKLVWRNLARVAAIDMVGDILIFLGKIIIAVVTTGLVGLWVVQFGSIGADLSSPIFPLVVVFILSYIIASIFMVVFETSIDTIFLCFLIDEECFKGTQQMFASESLLSVVDKYHAQSADKAKEIQRKRGMLLQTPVQYTNYGNRGGVALN